MTALSKKLEKRGFRVADDSFQPRLIVALSSMEKNGKTHFSLTAPGPIALFNMDVGLEGVVRKFVDDKEVLVIDLSVPVTQEDAQAEWDNLEGSYNDCLRDRRIRTIVFDTMTEVWELRRLASFGKLTQVMPHHYGPPNAVMRKIIRRAYDTDKNLILLHKMKSVYINDKRTANYEPAGFKDTPYLVQVNAQTFMYEKDEDEDEATFALYVKDSRHDPELAGMELQGPMCNFPALALMVYPDTDPEDWE